MIAVDPSQSLEGSVSRSSSWISVVTSSPSRMFRRQKHFSAQQDCLSMLLWKSGSDFELEPIACAKVDTWCNRLSKSWTIWSRTLLPIGWMCCFHQWHLSRWLHSFPLHWRPLVACRVASFLREALCCVDAVNSAVLCWWSVPQADLKVRVGGRAFSGLVPQTQVGCIWRCDSFTSFADLPPWVQSRLHDYASRYLSCRGWSCW